MSITGHLTRSVFDRYNITTTDDTLAALRKQREFVTQQPKSNIAAFRSAAGDGDGK